jgi:hypothetical protein
MHSRLKDVFGGGSVLFWPLPLQAEFDNEATVLGFSSGTQISGVADDTEDGDDISESSPLV